MDQALSMNQLIPVRYEGENPTVSARSLHAFLEVGTQYKDWFPRMCEYGFEEGKDYCSFLSDRSDGLPGRQRGDAALTLPMAKELCMLQRTERGKQARRYFIALEDAWNSPEAVMARALRMAEQRLQVIMEKNVRMSEEMAEMEPKAEYYDQLISRGLNLGIRETAREFGVKEREFTQKLLDSKYLYRNRKGNLMPYSQHSSLFVLRESINSANHWAGIQLLITPKGREKFMKMEYAQR